MKPRVALLALLWALELNQQLVATVLFLGGSLLFLGGSWEDLCSALSLVAKESFGRSALERPFCLPLSSGTR